MAWTPLGTAAMRSVSFRLSAAERALRLPLPDGDGEREARVLGALGLDLGGPAFGGGAQGLRLAGG